jgi:hypothetical protein
MSVLRMGLPDRAERGSLNETADFQRLHVVKRIS